MPDTATETPTEPQPSLQEEAEALQKLIAQGMPTDTEMRVSAPRTVQRHLDWEKRNRRNIVRYQELRRSCTGLPSIESLRLP